MAPTHLRRGKVRAARRRSRVRPYAQGDLDALCGVYAVVNAVQTLVPGFTRSEAKRLFQALVEALRAEDHGRRPLVAIGLTRRHVRQTLMNADHFLERRHRGRLVVWRLPRGVIRGWSLDRLWRLLSQRLGPTCVAILGIGGIHSHWTLAVAITPRSIRLLDSDGLQYLRRKRCRAPTSGYWARAHLLYPGYVIFVRWTAL